MSEVVSNLLRQENIDVDVVFDTRLEDFPAVSPSCLSGWMVGRLAEYSIPAAQLQL